MNNTTVEVTFGEEVEDIKALDFKIEGLEVSNAVVKQTDKKTVVLTTAPQTAGKEYTVTVNGDKVGKFAGVSAVLPESVSFVTKSIQGVYGQEVTVSAKVTVKEGESKAGIPVTFNIDSNADNSNGKFGKDFVAEAITNADGVATYSYTQYNTGRTEDLVTAYATGKANARATAEVYWANAARLSVKDVTEGTTVANSNTKVYQVTSTENASGYVAVAFKENLDVTPDKVTNGVHFTDSNVYSVDSNDNLTPSVAGFKGVPFEVTTGGHQVALVKLNSSGVGNFTLTGADASVTPIVYDFEGTVTETGSTPTKVTDLAYDATDLQATASTVKFEANQTAQITVDAKGVQNAAARTATATAAGNGGREYTVTLKDKDGKIAPEGQPVYIYFDKKSTGNSNNTTPRITLTQIVDGLETTRTDVTPATSNNLSDAVRLTVDSKGQVTFVVRGDLNDYATPIAVYDNGKSTEVGKIDSSDAQTTAEAVYFGTVKVGASKAKITSVATGKEVTSITGTDQAKIEYTAVDQNGFPYYNSTTANFDATFTFTEAFANYTVTGASEVSSENNRKTYKAQATNGKVTLYVSSSKGTVYFNASTTNNVLAPQSGSIAFNAVADAATLTGTVTAVDKTNNKVTLEVNGQPAVLSYADAVLYYKGSTVGVDEDYFESKLVVGAKVTYNKATDSAKARFNIFEDATTQLDTALVAVNNATSLAAVETALNSNKAAFTSAWDELNPTQKTAVATAVFNNRLNGYTASSLKAAYETAYATQVTAAIGATSIASPTLALLQAVPGLNTAALEALPVANPGQTSALAALANHGKTTLTDLQAALDTAVTTAQNAIGNAASVQALADINTGLTTVGTNATPAELTTALTALTQKAALAGISLAKFNTLTDDTEKKAALALITATAPTYNAVGLQNALDAAVENVKVDPTITKVTLSGTTLTLTFSENIVVGATAAGVITFTASPSSETTSTTATGATSANTTPANTLDITVTDAATDFFTVGTVIKAITNLDVKDTAGNALDITGLDIVVETP